MRAWRFGIAALAVAALVGCALAAQVPAPVRGSISGRIVSAATGRPIPGARATISVADYALGAVADADGAFRVDAREPGRYRVGGSAPGYRTRQFDEQPEIGATLVMVKDGQHVRDINIALHRGGTIAGVVTDDLKDPFVSGSVRAFAKRVQYGNVHFQSAGETKTDDLGSYRLTGLEPGEYIIGAVDSGVLTLTPSFVSATTATTIALTEDSERTGVNVQLRAVKPGAVEGTVTGPGAGSPRLVVQLVPNPSVANMSSFAAQVTAGRFGFRDVPAGRYNLVVGRLNTETPFAWTLTPVVVAPGRTTQVRAVVAAEPHLSGTVESVGLRQLTITLTPISSTGAAASSISVRAAAEGPFSLGAVPPGQYYLTAGFSEQADVLLPVKRPRLVDPGVHRLIGTVLVNGEDVSDRVFVVAPGKSIENIRVAVTETAAQITGTVLDAAGKPTTAGAVVVFPSDPREWTVVSRRIRVTRAGTDGVYHAPLLPPGRYRVAHVTSLAPGQLWDPAFLKTLSSAREIEAPAGGVATVELRLK